MAKLKPHEDGFKASRLFYQNDPHATSNRQAVIKMVQLNPYMLKSAKDYQNNFEVVLMAVKHCGHELEYASTELRNNKDIVRVWHCVSLQQN